MNGARDASNKHARTTARRFALADECSVTVAGERLYYKFFAEPKPACSIACAALTLFTYKEPVVEHPGHFAACLGLDWSDAKHDICLVDTATGSRELSSIRHTPAALDEWARALRARFGGRRVAVCLEQSRGPLIYALVKYDFLVLYPVNPKTLARFREAFPPSRAKDDPTDAAYLVELLLHHRDRLKAWAPDDERTRALQLLVEHRRRLVGDQTRLSNRMTALLKGYFPQVLAWFPDIRTEMVCDFLRRWPSLGALKGVRRTTLSKFFRPHNSHRAETIATRLVAIKEATPLVTDRAVIHASVLMVKALAARMKTTLEAVHEFDVEIAALCRAHEDFELFTSLPGAGQVYASRLLTAMGSNRERWQTADEPLRFSGVAPVIERSGKASWTRWRYFCPKFVRQSFVEYAGESVRHSAWARAFYALQKAKGKSHQAAVRALAYKWIRIIWKCWQARTRYDEARYLQCLRKKGSALVSTAV